MIHSAEHKRSFAELVDEEVALVAEAWRRRRDAHPEGYVHALVNEGAAAGASLAHSHSQLVWFEAEPPAVAHEVATDAALADLVGATAVERGLVVDRVGEVVAACTPAGRAPYEVVIAPTRAAGSPAFATEQLEEALVALRAVVRRVRAVEGPIAWNAWLHAQAAWHLEFVPRLGVLAGVELGAGVYINTLDAKEAARRLREAG